MNKMRKVYKDKHDLLLKLLGPFEAKFEITGENAGHHVLLRSKTGESEEALIKKAAEHSVKVYGLSDSFTDKGKTSATVIIGYGGLSEDMISEGIEKLAKAWLG